MVSCLLLIVFDCCSLFLVASNVFFLMLIHVVLCFPLCSFIVVIVFLCVMVLGWCVLVS